jgi:geranylgeranyl pyrophosphate synthase
LLRLAHETVELKRKLLRVALPLMTQKRQIQKRYRITRGFTMPEKKKMEQIRTLIEERGRKALEMSKQAILNEQIENISLRDALRYFMEETWSHVPHPALLSLACEAVGGQPDATTQVGAALALLAGAADIHDDIIDQSTIKGSKPTVFGKFGRDIALLAGDTMLFKGLYAMHEAVDSLPKGKKHAILKLTKQAFFGISSAEAQETSFRGKPDLSVQEFLENIKGKAAVAEATAKIGATLGDANANEIEMLGNYGKILGILMTIRDQFIDLFEPDEIKERAERECLPLPILFVFRDEKKRKKIERLLKKGDKITKEDADKIVDIVMTAKETSELRRQMQRMIDKAKAQLAFAEHNPTNLKFILESTMEDLE